ncbi:MAG: hypothetical protein KGL39_50765, partial [Patescibacteria group bacterium]|nr:hypothetical protein [Patescibacteria group bacterium]
YPTTGWVTVKTVTGNIFNAQDYLVNMTGYNHVRMNITSTNGTGVPYLKMAVFDAPAGDTDGLFLEGDSITANDLTHKGGANPPNAFASQFAAGQMVLSGGTYYPNVMVGTTSGYICGGMAFWTTANWAAQQANFLAGFNGPFVGISLGTNDLPILPITSYQTAMQSLISYAQGLGKTVLMATMPYCTDVQHNAGFVNYRAAEAALRNATGALGPDFFSFFFGFVSLSACCGSTGITGLAGNTLTDANNQGFWSTNCLQGAVINDLTQKGTLGTVVSNTTTSITFSGGTVTPLVGDVYNVSAKNYTASGGSTTTLVDTSQNWAQNVYYNCWLCNVTKGWSVQISSNTSNTLTFPTQGTAASAGDIYTLNGQNLVTAAPYGDAINEGNGTSQALHPGATGGRAQRILWGQSWANAMAVTA